MHVIVIREVIAVESHSSWNNVYDFDKKLLDLGMFMQVVHQLIALNALVDKIWLPPSTVVRGKPALHEVLSSVLVCFNSSEEIKIVSCWNKSCSFMFSNRFGVSCVFYSVFPLGMQFIPFLLKSLNWFNPLEWLWLYWSTTVLWPCQPSHVAR